MRRFVDGLAARSACRTDRSLASRRPILRRSAAIETMEAEENQIRTIRSRPFSGRRLRADGGEGAQSELCAPFARRAGASSADTRLLFEATHDMVQVRNRPLKRF